MYFNSGGFFVALAAELTPETATNPTVARLTARAPLAARRKTDLLRTVIPPEIVMSAPAIAGHDDPIPSGVGFSLPVTVWSLPVHFTGRETTVGGRRPVTRGGRPR